MKKITEQEQILDLINKGFHVEVKNPYGKSFREKYNVYDGFNWYKLKLVNYDENNLVSGKQG